MTKSLQDSLDLTQAVDELDQAHTKHILSTSLIIFAPVELTLYSMLSWLELLALQDLRVRA